MGHSLELPSLLKDAAHGQLRQLLTGTVQGLVNVKWKVRAWQNPENYSCLRIDFVTVPVQGGGLHKRKGWSYNHIAQSPQKCSKD